MNKQTEAGRQGGRKQYLTNDKPLPCWEPQDPLMVKASGEERGGPGERLSSQAAELYAPSWMLFPPCREEKGG